MSEDGGDNQNPKRRACTECHKCKSKCVYPKHLPQAGDYRCERCIRLKKELCVPHISRQGKRKSLDYSSDNNSVSQQQQQQQQQQYLLHQHHPCQQVTSSSQLAAALAMNHPNNIGNQSQIMDMIESMKNNGGGDGGGNNGLIAGAGTNNLLNNHNMLGGGGGNFNASVNNSHHLAQQIQNNTFFAKNANLLQQQQQQQQQQQSYLGDVNNMTNSGLNSILSRAIGDSNNSTLSSAAVVASTVSSGVGVGGVGVHNIPGGNNFTNNVSGLSANLLSGLDSNTLSRVINQLNNNNNGNGGGLGCSPNNLDLLYQAANSQRNQQKQQQQQQGVGYNMAGNQQLEDSVPSNAKLGNHTNNNMLFSQEKRRNSTGSTASYPSPQISQQHNNNAKSTAPVSNSGVNNNRNNNINNDQATNSGQIRADSRLKKQKKHHKFFPPEYPPVSLLQSHSASGTPSSSQAGEGNLSRSSSTQNFITPEEAIGSHYMSACARHSELTLSSLKHHYGLQCQIREWISMALARRSFALLSRASSLAHRCNMHMDRILSGGFQDDDCGEGHAKCKNKKCAGPRMHYLLSMLLEPQSKIRIPIEDRHMLLPHFPPAFLSVIGCQNGQFFQESEIRNRWIIVRETRCGISRFFCSPAFERNVLCWAHVSQIYEDNLADIHSLIFVKDQFRRFLACNAYQIWSHSGEGMPPRPVHAPKTRVRLLSKRWGLANYQDDGVTNPVTKSMIQQVDDVMTLEMDLLFVSFPTMDKTTYYLEFFHSATNDSSTPVIGNSSIPRGLSNVSLNMEAGDDLSQGRQQSPESTSANPPTFDDIMESEEWVGIDDVMASGDINELMDALLN